MIKLIVYNLVFSCGGSLRDESCIRNMNKSVIYNECIVKIYISFSSMFSLLIAIEQIREIFENLNEPFFDRN